MSSKKDLDDGLGGFGFEGEDGSDAVLTVSFRRRTLIAAISTVQPDRFCAGLRPNVFLLFETALYFLQVLHSGTLSRPRVSRLYRGV